MLEGNTNIGGLAGGRTKGTRQTEVPTGERHILRGRKFRTQTMFASVAAQDVQAHGWETGLL